MAAAVARGNTQLSSLSVTEKGSRNKRKFRADAPQAESCSVELPSDTTHCEAYCGWNMCNIHHDGSLVSELRLSNAYSDQGQQDQEDFHDADWGDDMENMLEELMLNNLDTIFRSAIRKITSYGYNEEFASRAVLRSGVCYGFKDTVSNIVDNTLAFLRNGQEMDPSRELFFEDLQQLKRYLLVEMVCVLKQLRPLLSIGDAMWTLLICDMNMSHACAVDITEMHNFTTDVFSGSSSCTSHSDNPITKTPIENPFHHTRTIPCMPDTPVTGTCDLCILSSSPEQNFSPSEDPRKSEGETQQHEKLSYLGGHSDVCPDHSRSSPISSISQLPSIEEKYEKFNAGSKTHTHSAKKDASLRQRAVHFEKTYKAYGAKSSIKSGRINAFGGLILDKKCRSISNPNISSSRHNSLKLSGALGAEIFPTIVSSSDCKDHVVTSADVDFRSNQVEGMPLQSPVDTDLSLSLLSSENSGPISKCSFLFDSLKQNFEGYSNKNLHPWNSQYRTDEMLLHLVPRIRQLQNQLQEWTEWARQKVMQAAHRLNKDKAELKTLRQEKEEVARLKKEKQTLEENTMKKLAEMENALCKASGQVERANAAVRRLEAENAELKQEMEAAKLRAIESAASCQEVSKREKKTLKKFQSWEKQKVVLQEELLTEKRKHSKIQQQLDHARELYNQFEARLRQEEKMKEGAQIEAESERRKREQTETWAKADEEMIRVKSEHDLQTYREEISRLDSEITRLRLKIDSPRISTLRWDLDKGRSNKSGSYPKETEIQNACVAANSQSFGNYDVRREWECVMCLTDEISVVFLPCAHQVVCGQCNELHEKQGMGDCPSCRTVIKQRVCVRFANC